MECRRWSLIPQGSKFKVSYAKDVTEALGTLPSIAEPTERDSDETDMDEAMAVEILRAAVGSRPLRVTDRSRLRFVLYRSGASRTILNKILNLLPVHPEHIDAFAAFFQNYSKSRLIVQHVTALARSAFPFWDKKSLANFASVQPNSRMSTISRDTYANQNHH